MTEVSDSRLSLNDYLQFEYPFHVIADNEIGGFVIVFPDLPGCITHVERVEDVGRTAESIRQLWIRTQYEDGDDVPLPSYPEEYSGKFNVCLPRSLHRQLAESAGREGVSFNQYVVMLLSRGDALAAIERQHTDLKAELKSLREAIAVPAGR